MKSSFHLDSLSSPLFYPLFIGFTVYKMLYLWILLSPFTAQGMPTQNHSRTPGPQHGSKWPPVGSVLLCICGRYLLLWCWVPVETLDMMNEQYTDIKIITINLSVHIDFYPYMLYIAS